MMSKDRVKFRFSDTHNQKRENVHAAMRAFNIQGHIANSLFERAALIVCRPSQFARFIVYRVEAGITINRIAQMELELFTPGVSEDPFDVSKNDHGYPK